MRTRAGPPRGGAWGDVSRGGAGLRDVTHPRSGPSRGAELARPSSPAHGQLLQRPLSARSCRKSRVRMPSPRLRTDARERPLRMGPPEDAGRRKRKVGPLAGPPRALRAGPARERPAPALVTTSEGVRRRQRCWSRCWLAAAWCSSEVSGGGTRGRPWAGLGVGGLEEPPQTPGWGWKSGWNPEGPVGLTPAWLSADSVEWEGRSLLKALVKKAALR